MKILKFFFYWIIVIFFGWVLYTNAGDYSKIAQTIQSADYVFLGWAIVFSIGNISIMSAIFKANFSIFENEVELGLLFPEVISYSFMMVSNPLGTTGAIAYLVKRLMSKGHSYLKSFFSFLSTQLSINLVFLPILAVTMLYLKERQILNSYEIIASSLLVVLNLTIIFGISTVLVLPKFSLSIAKLLSSIANKITNSVFKKSFINEKKVDLSIQEIQKTSGRFDKSIGKFFKTFIFSAIYHFINITVLYFCFSAFGTAPSFEILISIYSITVLFTIVSPTPQGIGIVEGLAQIGAISLGVSSELSIIAILTYRLVSIWIPAFLGFLVFRSSKKQNKALSN